MSNSSEVLSPPVSPSTGISTLAESCNEFNRVSRREVLTTIGSAIGTLALAEVPWVRLVSDIEKIQWQDLGIDAILEANLVASELDPAWSTVEAPSSFESTSPAERYALQQATDLYNNLRLFSTPLGLMRNKAGSPDGYAANWGYGRFTAAAIAGWNLPGQLGKTMRADAKDSLDKMIYFWDEKRQAYLPNIAPLALGNDDSVYNDDNYWNALNALRYFRLTGDKEFLELTQKLHQGRAAQWLKDGGGIPWFENIDGQISGPVTVSNMPGAIIAQELYLLTGNPIYNRKGHGENSKIPDAHDICDWSMRRLLDSRDGLLYDGFGPDNQTLLTKKYVYGQGVGARALYSLGRTEEAYDMIKGTLARFDYIHGQIAPLMPESRPQVEYDNAFIGIFFENALAVTQKGNPELNRRVRYALAETIKRQRTQYPLFIEQAGALHVAVLGALNPPD